MARFKLVTFRTRSKGPGFVTLKHFKNLKTKLFPTFIIFVKSYSVHVIDIQYVN